MLNKPMPAHKADLARPGRADRPARAGIGDEQLFLLAYNAGIRYMEPFARDRCAGDVRRFACLAG